MALRRQCNLLLRASMAFSQAPSAPAPALLLGLPHDKDDPHHGQQEHQLRHSTRNRLQGILRANTWSAIRGYSAPAGGGSNKDGGKSTALAGLATTIDPQVDWTGDVLETLNVLRLREELEFTAQHTMTISYSRLLKMVSDSGTAMSDQGAREIVDAFEKSGTILRYHDVVYLRPLEVAEMVLKVLPGTSEEAQMRLAEVELELEDMVEVRDEIDAMASKWPNRFLVGGCLFLFLQLVGFAYLTWWELSWDVMEPIGFHVSLFYSWVGYTYFLWTGNAFDHAPFKTYWTDKQKAKLLARGFDVDRYNLLVKMRDRYKRLAAKGLSTL